MAGGKCFGRMRVRIELRTAKDGFSFSKHAFLIGGKGGEPLAVDLVEDAVDLGAEVGARPRRHRGGKFLGHRGVGGTMGQDRLPDGLGGLSVLRIEPAGMMDEAMIEQPDRQTAEMGGTGEGKVKRQRDRGDFGQTLGWST